MALLARFEYGAKKFKLNDGRLTVGEGFTPPPTSRKVVSGQDSYAGQVYAREGTPRTWKWTLHVEADSETEATLLLEKLQQFLDRAGNPRKPVYFAFRTWGETFDFEPTWGQFGAFTRYRVLTGMVEYGRMEAIYDDGKVFACPITLTIDPYSYGLAQRAATATGGVYEEWQGLLTGRSRGVRVGASHSGYENKITNPVFGNATWNAGWTAGSNVSAAKNVDPEGVLVGYASAHLQCRGATNNTFTFAINAGNTNTHAFSCYVKALDGSNATDMLSVIYGGSIRGSFAVELDDDWWYVYATMAGIASSQALGLSLENGADFYLAGAQFEQSSWPNPLVHGGMYGASWAGTAHNSGTDMIVGSLLAPAERGATRGTIQMTIRCLADASTLANDIYFLFDDNTDEFSLSYVKGGSSYWNATGGSGVAVTSVDAPEMGELFVFHITWEYDTFAFYVNGVQIGTDTFAVTPSAATAIYLGSELTPSQQGPWQIMDFEVFAAPMAAADVLAFYNQVHGVLTAGTDAQIEQVAPIPYVWTKDGDDVLDNCDDSTRDNWALINGVPGTAPAETDWLLTPSVGTKDAYWLMRAQVDYGRFVYPNGEWYQDMSGSLDGTCSGGGYSQDSGEFSGVAAVDAAQIEKAVHLFARCAAVSAADMLLYGSVFVGASFETTLAQRRVSMPTAFTWYYIGTAYFEYPVGLLDQHKAVKYKVLIDRADGTSADKKVDFMLGVPEAMNVINPIGTTLTKLRLIGREAYGANSTDGLITPLLTKGDEINLMPGIHNLVWAVSAADGEAQTITDTMTLSEVVIRPRYLLQ